MIDRELYLPKEWAQDKDRRKVAGVPKTVTFSTKLVLARGMIDRAMAAGVRAKWVTADPVYGSDYHFRTAIEGHGLGYVVGVRTDFAVWAGFRQVRARALLAEVRRGRGKGPRVYDWALLRTSSPEPKEYARWLLIRRNVSDPTVVAYFARGGAPGTTLDELVRVAGTRWVIEECFELGKGDCGLDEYEVRSWTGWYRHVTLSLWALAVVSTIRAKLPRSSGRKKGSRS